MKINARTLTLFPLGVLALLSGAVWAAQTALQLTMDDKVVSTDIQMIKGRAYVPLADVARLLNRTVVRQGHGYDITRATTPVGQPHALPGKMATNLFSGLWRFQVASVQQVAAYTPLYGPNKEALAPRETGDTLALVTCQLRNGSGKMQEVSFDKDSSGNTAITDDQEHGYVPVGYDARGSNYTSAKIPAGTTLDFVMIFSIPRSANLTRLTYSVGGIDFDKHTEFHVALEPVSPQPVR